jgi:hypothetical protein
MSALPPEADIRQRIEHVCFVPLSAIAYEEAVSMMQSFNQVLSKNFPAPLCVN